MPEPVTGAIMGGGGGASMLDGLPAYAVSLSNAERDLSKLGPLVLAAGTVCNAGPAAADEPPDMAAAMLSCAC